MKKILSLFLTILFVVLAVAPFNSSITANASADIAAPLAASAPSSAAGEGYVFDNKDNKLYYDSRDGAVFTQNESMVYTTNPTDGSSPVYYNPATKKFTDTQQDVLTLFDRPSSRGGQYLRNGSYTVGSTFIDETFYSLPRPGNQGDILATLTMNIKENKVLGFTTSYTYTFIIKNLLGHVLSKNDLSADCAPLFESHKQSVFSIASKIIINVLTPLQLDVIKNVRDEYPSGSLYEWLEVIELANPNAEVLSVKDDRGRAVNVVDGQLFDYMDFPIIGNDYKPLFYDNGVYFAFDGEQYTVSGSKLVDYKGNPVRVHSVITELLAGDYLFFLFMKDGVTLCPLHGEPELDDKGEWTGTFSFSYLNGKPINESDFVIPEISVDDTYNKYPELRPEIDDLDTLAWLKDLFSSGGSGSDWLRYLAIIGGVIVLVILFVSLWPYIKILLGFIALPFQMLTVKGRKKVEREKNKRNKR